MFEFGSGIETKEILRPRQIIIFSDIDGTILEGSSFEKSKPSLQEMAEKKVPLVFVTSKTAAEVEDLKKEMADQGIEINHPYVVENGGGIFVPKNYFSFSLEEIKPEGSEIRIVEDGYWLTFGQADYEQLREELRAIATAAGAEIVGFGNWTDEELAKDSGLNLNQAHLAKIRQFDEPFKILIGQPEIANQMASRIRAAGYEYHQGGVYHHISTPQDKKRAVEALMAFYRKQFEQAYFVGLGDAPADESFVSICDTGKIVSGPADFNEFVSEKMRESLT